MQSSLPPVMFFAERDEPIVMPQSRSLGDMVQLDTPNTAAMVKADNAGEGCKL